MVKPCLFDQMSCKHGLLWLLIFVICFCVLYLIIDFEHDIFLYRLTFTNLVHIFIKIDLISFKQLITNLSTVNA